MSRPPKKREVRRFPKYKKFVASDRYGRRKSVRLGYDELEVLRLTDLENLSQEDCANMLQISRQSVQLALKVARAKITKALIKGETIVIEGGNYFVHECPFKCNACGHEFPLRADAQPTQCPSCGSDDIHCTSEEFCSSICSRKASY
ncbi:DUF134 domain-containing protein [Guggenheimella bovis]